MKISIMQNVSVKRFMTFLLVVPFFVACKKNSGSAPASSPVRVYKGTQAPGDVWNWTLNDTAHTFTAVWDHGTTDPSDDITLGGTYTVLSTGGLPGTI